MILVVVQVITENSKRLASRTVVSIDIFQIISNEVMMTTMEKVMNGQQCSRTKLKRNSISKSVAVRP
jgi:hypothetical protein